MSEDPPLLDVRNLKKHYPITKGVMRNEVGRVRAVDGIDFTVRRGETLGLVGESGCGKSTAATTTLRLEEPTSGAIVFDGEDISEYDNNQLKTFRRRAQMIFQDPTSSFDPRMSIGESVAEPLRVHGMRDRSRRRRIAENLLERVGLEANDADRYPHEFSGGQKQRVALARALVVRPEFLVADEPVSALDVSIQAEILTLINDLQEEFGLGILFISHDMGVVREVADRVAVMYLGEIVEVAPADELFENPQHPYTKALLSSIPTPDPRHRGESIELRGDVPSPSNPPQGCRFHTRCPEVIQPEGFEFEQETWVGIVDFRTHVARGEVDPASTRELAVTENAEFDGPGEVTDEDVKETIRTEFEIPQTLSDSQAESVLNDALDSLVAGDRADAIETLSTEFASVCDQHHPELERSEAGNEAACHLVGSSPGNAEGNQQPHQQTGD